MDISSTAKEQAMKYRILFVDDEHQVLHGLRRMLHSQSREWELHFAPGGKEALELMAATSMDVVVSDMRMPGMDGLQLLTEVKELYPNAARVALSGHMDERMIMGSTKVVHQYLSKPCSPEALIAVLRRLLALRRYLAEEALTCLSSSLEQIPSLPKLYVAIQEELQSSHCSLKKVGEIISTDVGMSAKILQLVNSSFFGMYTKVTSPAQAVNLLGTETVKALVLHVQIFSQYDPRKCPRLSLARLARHSLMTATLTKRICAMENESRDIQEDAFLAGILHDVGKLIFAVNCPGLYDEILEMVAAKNMSLPAVEREVLGAGHAQLGAYVLGLWGMSDPVLEAIAFHHEPVLSTTTQFVPLTALHAANALTIQLQPEGPTGMPEGLDADYLAFCGLSDRISLWEGMARDLFGMAEVESAT
ncbi:response regulator [Desulfonatronum thiodismutans]|uniref:response regulator n=1 Tax=Desulfonatronum thiodismutans TaxID=159290 RepID=UPI0006917B46|nr:response regulator [Desulfonatronum thiodismutans]